MASVTKWIRWNIFLYWKSWVAVFTPLVLLPLPIVINTPEAKAGYVLLLMSVYWMSECLPLAITSLLPIAVFPLLNIMSTNDVCSQYFKGSIAVFFCAVSLALGAEQSNLHRRVAYKILLFIGADPKWIMLAFMIVTMILSMWISNNAVTAMLIPIVRSILIDIFEKQPEEESLKSTESGTTVAVNIEPDERIFSSDYQKKVYVALNLSIAYASSIGGYGTLIGSGPPLLLKGIVENALSFPSYMALAMPIVVINILLTWLWLSFLFIGFRLNKQNLKDSATVKKNLTRDYEKLGPLNFHETAVTVLFITLVLLWCFRDPGFIPGWLSLFPDYDVKIGDATPGVIIVVIAYMLPARPTFWCLKTGQKEIDRKPSASVLDWRYTQKHFPWNALLLLGGGYALAEAIKISQLSDWMSNQLMVLSVLPPIVVMLLACLIVTSFTEIAANAAAAAIFLPIFGKLAESMGGNPLYLMIPVTISCCHAFMLPVGTPCNAMVISTTKIETSYMVKAGAVINIFTLVVTCGVTAAISPFLFN